MASCASHGWEAVNNHMWPDKPVRQAREPSEELVDTLFLFLIQSLPTLLHYAFTYTSDIMGGYPPPPLSEKKLT